VCRETIQTLGVSGNEPGDFIPPSPPSAAAFAYLGAAIGDLRPFVNVTIVELPPALADRLIDQRAPTPPECAHITVDGRYDAASIVERPLPGFGERARYIVRTFPVAGKPWTERTLQYRTATYVVLIRMDAFAVPEPTFLTFARKTRTGLDALPKT
jgi:hypothetical protein